MIINFLDANFTVCKVDSFDDIDLDDKFLFVGKTDEELSLVCSTEKTPAHTLEREDGWKGFRIEGTLDFSLVGILSKISSVMAENGIGIFAVSTYNTDYVLVKKENISKAKTALEKAGYDII